MNDYRSLINCLGLFAIAFGIGAAASLFIMGEPIFAVLCLMLTLIPIYLISKKPEEP